MTTASDAPAATVNTTASNASGTTNLSNSSGTNSSNNSLANNATTNGNDSSSSNSNSNSNDSNNMPAPPTDTRRRVKLYMLNANRTWDDRGTGHVSSSYIDRLSGMSLLVKAETDGSLLLESRILADTAYQKQQDTLIVWSEGENYDLALSFQERAGCEEIWNKICQVQGKDPSVDITQDIIEDDENELPPCEPDRLDEISTLISSSLTMQSKKDSITLALESENYIPKLLTLFRTLEERKDVASLAKMYDIFKSIFLLNRNSLFDIMLSEEQLWDVIGVFEYDPTGAAVREAKDEEVRKKLMLGSQNQPGASTSPSQPNVPLICPGTPPLPPLSRTAQPANANPSSSSSYFSTLASIDSDSNLMRLIRDKRHREFLRNVSRFKEVIPLSKSELVAKIHQTYRVQYIQDVILPTPSVFEDNMLSTLSSFIFFNKVEIVSLIQQDDKFLKELFRQLTDDSPAVNEKRRDLVMFLKELCTFSHTLQLQNREMFIKTLAGLGLLHTLEVLLGIDDMPVKLGAVDILTYIVDYSPSMVREYALAQEANEKDEQKYLLNIIIVQMICDTDTDLGMATQLSNILKLLIDPENMLTASPINKSEKSEFLNYFYRHCINYLTKPILAATLVDGSGGPEETAARQRVIELNLCREQSCQSAQLFAIILELMTFCIEHHAYHIRGYLLSKDVVRSIVILTKSKHRFLVLSVIRFIRRLVGLKDEFYNRHIITVNLFGPIVDAFLANKGRYNLLDSAVIDLFEFVHSNSILSLCNYTIENFWKGKLEHIDYVKTFKSMRAFYEQQSAMRERIDTNSFLIARNRYRRDPRQLDKEEDMWFNAEDDDEEEDGVDDDEDDDCENYHDEDDTDSPPPPISQRTLQQQQAAAAAASAASSAAVLQEATAGFYGPGLSGGGGGGGLGQGAPSAHKSQGSTISSLQSLHHSLSQQSSVSSTTSSGVFGGGGGGGGGGGLPQPQTATGAGGGGGHLSSTSSAYESPTSAFIDSPFFSSFAANQKKKFERKSLTINLSTSKSPGYMSSSSNNSATSSSAVSSTSPQVLSAFSGAGAATGTGGLSSSSSNTAGIVSTSVNHSASSPNSSRKALVDYPDEDSDEEDDEDHEEDLDDDDDLDDGLLAKKPRF